VTGWPSENLLSLIRRLDNLEIDWVVGGSYASSTFGESRTTQDVDVMIRLRPGQLDALIEDFQWYLLRARRLSPSGGGGLQ
jgi:hypothetical protein